MTDTGQDIKNQLFAEGGIEGFVQSGRTPLLTEPSEESTSVWIFVPPEGTQRGDHYRTRNYMDALVAGYSPEGMGDTGTIEFLSPEGQSRGYCEIVSLTMEEYKVLRKRRMRAINQYNAEIREPSILTPLFDYFRRK